MHMGKKRVLALFGPGDAGIILLALVAGFLVYPRATQTTSPALVRIYRGNIKIGEYPLTQNRTLNILGYEGPMVIDIQNEAASVKRSSCYGQICVHSGVIVRPGQQIVCAPNRILVEIFAPDHESRPDAVTR